MINKRGRQSKTTKECCNQSCEKKSPKQSEVLKRKKKLPCPATRWLVSQNGRNFPSEVAKRGRLYFSLPQLQQNRQDRRLTDSRRLSSTTPGRTTAHHTHRHLLERERMLILLKRPASCSIFTSFNTRFLQLAYFSVSVGHYFSRQFPRSFFKNAPPHYIALNQTTATAALDIRISTHHSQSAVLISETLIHQLATTPAFCVSKLGQLKRTFSSVTSGSPPTPVIERMSVSNIPRTLEIRLTEQETKICEVLDAVSKRYEEKEGKKVQLRIAGGWVRDKVWVSDTNSYFRLEQTFILI